MPRIVLLRSRASLHTSHRREGNFIAENQESKYKSQVTPTRDTVKRQTTDVISELFLTMGQASLIIWLVCYEIFYFLTLGCRSERSYKERSGVSASAPPSSPSC